MPIRVMKRIVARRTGPPRRIVARATATSMIPLTSLVTNIINLLRYANNTLKKQEEYDPKAFDSKSFQSYHTVSFFQAGHISPAHKKAAASNVPAAK
jgi:hypothetical protein